MENCKHESGYYRLFKVDTSWRGSTNYDFDGTIAEDNTMMFDTITITEFKTKYCQDCHKRLCHREIKATRGR